MSVIEKMSITGIRSFSPDDRQVIEFFRPLTLILGPNGCGKTTLIECLRYVTTGDMPPNSDRGGSFVHDPKFAGEQEVKAQVKLQFKDVMGKKVIVTRSLMVSQTLKKLTLKTLEGTLTRYGSNGEKTQLSTKCAEIDAEMIGSLGVSKAILNHVIFCHQEESNWPLSEGKALKQRFDEIFAATRYIKALEEIRKIRTEKMGEIKIYETQVESLVSNKRKADEFQRELESTEARLSASKDTVQGIEDKLKPNSAKILEIKQKQETIGKLQGCLEKGLELLKKYEEDERDLRKTLGEKVFVGSMEDLKKEKDNFIELVKVKKIEQHQLLQLIVQKENAYQTDVKNKAKLLEELGILKSDHNRYTSQVKLRDSKLRAFRKDLGLGEVGFDEDEPLGETQVTNVMQSLKQRNSATRIEHQNCKAKHEANESRLVNVIQEVCMEKAQKQVKLSSNNEQVAKNKTSLRNINDELTRLDSLANLQDNVEKDLKEAEEELKSVEGSTNVEELRQQLSAKQQKRDETDAQLTVLNQEMNILQKESKVRHEIDLYSKELNSKQESVERVLNRHKDTLIHLLQKVPEQGVYEKVTSLVQNLNQKTQEVNKDLEKLRSKMSSLETTKKIQSNQLSSKEELLTSNQNKIFDVCGSQDFECGFESLKTNIQSLQDEKGTMTGSLYLFNKYVEELQRPRSKCPLCKRGFDEAQAAQDLVENLKKKLQLLPRRMEEKTRLLADKEKQLTQLMELRPVKEAVTTLQNKEIPELKKKLETVTVEISETSAKIGELEELLDNLSSDLKMASNLLPELVLLDQNQGDAKRLTRKLATLKAQIGGKDITRTVQQVSEEQTTLQAQVKSVGREVERLQERISSFVEEVQQLRGRVNDLKADKNQMCSDLQKRVQLTQQSETLMKENASLAEATKAVKSEIFALEGKIKDLYKEKGAVTDLKEEELEKLTAKIREEEREIEEIENISSEISRYLRADREKKLVAHEDVLFALTRVMEKKKKELVQLDEREKVVTKEITSQELVYRNLDDNLKLFENIKMIGKMNAESENLKKEIGGFNVKSLNSELERLVAEQRSLTKQRDEATGRADVLRDQLRSLRKQLGDDMFKDADLKHRNKCIELRTTQLVCEDLSKYYVALNKAIMSYHQLKMKEINKIIKELWFKTYAGNDIDYIEIQSDEDGERGLEKARRTFNYRVVMFKGSMSTDMRGRCSAGQKVLASLIIRLALAETFCLNCGILALDEPTTNLDRENISKLARALIEIVESRSEQRNFQLIIITHDEDFITCLGRSEIVDYYYKVSKDNNAHSRISKLYIADMA